MGQVHSVRTSGNGETGSNAMPHFGQGPGPACSTSECIGQEWIAWVAESFIEGSYKPVAGIVYKLLKLEHQALNQRRQLQVHNDHHHNLTDSQL